MPHIQQLAPHVADLIAAGEVVERPASVVKELVENALDAGSSAVTVEIRRGGMGMIRVSDNGCGIPAAELPTAFLRHATSKLRSEEDLGRIGTLGFRGEALAAICAVSRVEIISRTRQEEAGASLHLEGGVPGEVVPAGAPEGTTIVVRDLFYNTPARLKFMRKDSAETAAINALLQHLALSHPEVSFRLIKDGTEALHTPGDGRLESAVYAALGRDFTRSLVAVEGRGGEVSVSGFVNRPELGRGSRSMQVFFVNGRFIKSQLLTAALEEGYRNQLLKGKFPGCVLAVTLPVTAVDVNVHPAKTQVKFAREREVFDAVYHTVLDSLDAALTPRAAPPAQAPRADFFQTMDAKTFREQAANRSPARDNKPARPGWDTERRSGARLGDSVPAMTAYRSAAAPTPAIPASPAKPAATKPAMPMKPQTVATPASSAEAVSPAKPAPVPQTPVAPDPPPAEQQTLTMEGEAPWRMVGEVLRTYIVCEAADGCVWLIDKHAAHERINFDRLKAQAEPIMGQQLLAPVVLDLPQEQYAALLEQLPLLEEFGFVAEDFGSGSLVVRSIPSDIETGQIRETLEELAEKLLTCGSADSAAARDALLHTMACKAAIKGGWHSDEAELRFLIDKVQSGEVQFCPHGRPVKVKLTKYEVEKMFKRA